MSKKINLALWRWLARKKESGFALPLVLMLGLVMSIIAITMIGRSQNDQLDAVSQKKTEQVRLVTEGGIDRALTILNQARLALITDVNDDDKIDELDWENFYPYNSTKTVKELFDEAYPNTDNSTAEIVSYSYSKDTNTATLVVKGSLNDGVKTQSQIKVTIPVIIDKPDSRDSVASIIGEDIELQQSDVIGNIICSVPAVNNSSVNDGDNCQATGDNENDLRNAIGANSSNAKIIDPEDTSKTGEIKVGTVKIPDVPDSPSDATVYDLGNIYSDLKLPRSGDKPYNGVYYYEINKVDKASLLIKEDSQVRLYVKGNIELSGNDAIT
ncbi:MAG: hypothetical protein QNJ54_18780, partial [Prochloraceae cyanobacterium]|nr:hypothetical protein [Prochloraceae cyanobacterium]